MIRKILFGLVISLILINISFGFSDEKRELYQKTLNAASGDFERMEEFLEILNKKEEDFSNELELSNLIIQETNLLGIDLSKYNKIQFVSFNQKPSIQEKGSSSLCP